MANFILREHPRKKRRTKTGLSNVYYFPLLLLIICPSIFIYCQSKSSFLYKRLYSEHFFMHVSYFTLGAHPRKKKKERQKFLFQIFPFIIVHFCTLIFIVTRNLFLFVNVYVQNIFYARVIFHSI